MRARPFCRAMILVALVLVSSSCSDRGSARASVRLLPSISDVVEWRGNIRLEENQRTINVSPRVVLDRNGTFLVADGVEQQVRFYDTDGRLRGTFGRRGRGPGEFTHIGGVQRLNDRTILV